MTRPIGLAVAVLGLMAGAAERAHAALIISMEEVGGDVVLTGSGTANIADLTFLGAGVDPVSINPTGGNVLMGPSPIAVMSYDVYLGAGFSGPATFGTGGLTLATTTSGDVFGILFGDRLRVPPSYVSGSSLSATATYAGTNFATLGVTPGTYTWTWGTGANADSLTLQIGPATVPEPSTLAVMGIALCGGAWLRRRKPRAA